MSRNPILFHKRAEAVKLATILAERFKVAPTDAGKLIHAILVEFLHSQRGNRACNTEVCEIRMTNLRDQILQEFREYIVEREGTDDLALGLEHTEHTLALLGAVDKAVAKMDEIITLTETAIRPPTTDPTPHEVGPPQEGPALSGFEDAEKLRDLNDERLKAQVEADNAANTYTVKSWGTREAVIQDHAGNKFTLSYEPRMVSALNRVYGFSEGAKGHFDAKHAEFTVDGHKPIQVNDVDLLAGRVFAQSVERALDDSAPSLHPWTLLDLTVEMHQRPLTKPTCVIRVSAPNHALPLLLGHYKTTVSFETNKLTVWEGKTHESRIVYEFAIV